MVGKEAVCMRSSWYCVSSRGPCLNIDPPMSENLVFRTISPNPCTLEHEVYCDVRYVESLKPSPIGASGYVSRWSSYRRNNLTQAFQ